jgi:glutathione S-transferase
MKDVTNPNTLFSSEGSPYSRIVREALNSLELPYLLHNCPTACGTRGLIVAVAAKRNKCAHRFGHKLSAARKALGMLSLPLLADPNTGRALTESLQILAYL